MKKLLFSLAFVFSLIVFNGVMGESVNAQTTHEITVQWDNAMGNVSVYNQTQGVSIIGTTEVNDNDIIQIIANPETGYEFDFMLLEYTSGPDSQTTDNPFSFYINDAMTITVNFSEVPSKLISFGWGDFDKGIIEAYNNSRDETINTAAPYEVYQAENYTIEMIEQDPEFWRFSHWQVDYQGGSFTTTDNPYSSTVTPSNISRGDLIYIPIFEEIEYRTIDFLFNPEYGDFYITDIEDNVIDWDLISTNFEWTFNLPPGIESINLHHYRADVEVGTVINLISETFGTNAFTGYYEFSDTDVFPMSPFTTSNPFNYIVPEDTEESLFIFSEVLPQYELDIWTSPETDITDVSTIAIRDLDNDVYYNITDLPILFPLGTNLRLKISMDSGYTFDGWTYQYGTSEGTTYDLIYNFTMPNNDITFFGDFTDLSITPTTPPDMPDSPALNGIVTILALLNMDNTVGYAMFVLFILFITIIALIIAKVNGLPMIITIGGIIVLFTIAGFLPIWMVIAMTVILGFAFITLKGGMQRE